jgi:hypothetical protein
MTRDDFDRHFSEAVADADLALTVSGHVDPLYLIVDRAGRGQLVAANNSSAENKTATMELVRLLAIAADAELVLNRGEAWLTLGDPVPGVPPSKSDRRREVVSVIASARVGTTILSRMSAREIVRGPDGKATGTVHLYVPDTDDEEFEGHMSELLPRETPTAAERRAARAIIERAQKRMGRGKSAFVRH